MAKIVAPNDIRQLGTIMSVWAHPDDESFTAAGIMATDINNGQKVICVTATRGEAGVQDESRWPAERLGEIRAKELESALEQIGVQHHHWLDYYDGQCNCVRSEEAVSKIKRLINKYKPDTILTFGPDGITGHTDHQTVSEWVNDAAIGTDITVYHSVEEEQRYYDYMVEAHRKFNIYFNIDKPPVFDAKDCDIAFRLPKDIVAKKYSALKCMPSQTETMIKNTPPETMEAMLCIECFVKAR